MQIVSNVSIVDISNFPFNLPSDQTQTQKKNLQISFCGIEKGNCRPRSDFCFNSIIVVLCKCCKTLHDIFTLKADLIKNKNATIHIAACQARWIDNPPGPLVKTTNSIHWHFLQSENAEVVTCHFLNL